MQHKRAHEGPALKLFETQTRQFEGLLMNCTISIPFLYNPPDIAWNTCSYKNSPSLPFTLRLPEVHKREARGGQRWLWYLLVRLQLASHYPEGVVGGVVIDLDSAEGLGASTSRQPLLIAIIVDHHGGPSLANTRLTGRAKTQMEFKGMSDYAQLTDPTTHLSLGRLTIK